MKLRAISLLMLAVSCLAAAPAKAGPRERFLADLQAALRGHDVLWLAAHTDYPLSLRGNRRKAAISSQAGFFKSGAGMFGPQLVRDILAQRPEDLSVNWQGMMIGSGSYNVWARDASPDPARPNYRIFSITGATIPWKLTAAGY